MKVYRHLFPVYYSPDVFEFLILPADDLFNGNIVTFWGMLIYMALKQGPVKAAMDHRMISLQGCIV